MTFEYNGLVWFQTIGLKETAVSDQIRFQANGGAVYNTPDKPQDPEMGPLSYLHSPHLKSRRVWILII